jgi:uncharacterized iron-regulated membrane protein
MDKQKILWQIHHWIGLYVGIVIGILSLTGAIAVFIPEIEVALDRTYHPGGSQPKAMVPMQVVLEKLGRQYEGYRLLGIYPPIKGGDALVFDYYHSSNTWDTKRVKVFLDPSTGEVLGEKDHLNSLPNYLRQVHVRLMDSWYGRQLVGLAGLGLFIVSITGLLIYGNFMKNQLTGAIRKGRGLRVVLADWHKLVGAAALVFNLMIALTGGWLGLQPVLMKWLDMQIPNHFKPEVTQTALSGEDDRKTAFNLYQALAVARAAIPQFEPYSVTPSADGSYTLEIRGDIIGLPYEPHINKVVLDKNSLGVLFTYDIREKPFTHRFYFLQEGLHFGRFAGVFTKIAYCLMGLTSGFLSISGFIIFLKRKEKKLAKSSGVLKTTFVATIAILSVLVLMGFAVTLVGYVPVTTVVTPLVYLGLCILVIWGLWDYKKKRKQVKKDILRSPALHSRVAKRPMK